MGRRVRTLKDNGGDIVPLGVEKQPDGAPPPAQRSGLHLLALSGMSISALTGICVLFLSIGIGLPASGRKVVTAIVVGAAVVFLTCASLAVFAAARETYPSKGSGTGGAE